jgi:hypothetical protein
MVESVADVVLVFNESVEQLRGAGVDPQVHRLADNYLPLHYSCPTDGRRLNLVRDMDGVDRFAVATCACGSYYRFWLGSRSTSLAQLTETDRWSVDVTLPIYLNDLVSGVVGGRSAALYGIVLGSVLEKVLSRRPVPTLVPRAMDASPVTSDQVDSLFYDYLVKGTT